MKIIFLGPPGAGKGTHAAELAKEWKIPHISTGDIFREAVKKGTVLGKQAKSYMDKGELVPDEVVVNVVLERLREADCKKGFILDGFPRSLKQAEMLDAHINTVIYFNISKETILMRLTGRRVCCQCGAVYHVKNLPPRQEGICDQCSGELYQRNDDKAETIENRLDVYNQETKALIEYYKKKKILREVNGNLEKEKGREELQAIFSSIKC